MIVRILFVVSLIGALMSPASAATAAPDDTVPPTSEIVVDEANPFLPENRDLTECIGTLQRPGCGSEARGGWHQNLVAIAMVGGLAIVFGRVAWSVRKSQKRAASASSD